MTTTIYFKLQMDMLITRSEDREQKRKHPLTAQVRIFHGFVVGFAS